MCWRSGEYRTKPKDCFNRYLHNVPKQFLQSVVNVIDITLDREGGSDFPLLHHKPSGAQNCQDLAWNMVTNGASMRFADRLFGVMNEHINVSH